MVLFFLLVILVSYVTLWFYSIPTALVVTLVWAWHKLNDC